MNPAKLNDTKNVSSFILTVGVQLFVRREHIPITTPWFIVENRHWDRNRNHRLLWTDIRTKKKKKCVNRKLYLDQILLNSNNRNRNRLNKKKKYIFGSYRSLFKLDFCFNRINSRVSFPKKYFSFIVIIFIFVVVLTRTNHIIRPPAIFISTNSTKYSGRTTTLGVFRREYLRILENLVVYS